MSKRNEFITFLNTLKAVSPTITDEQRVGLLRQAVKQYGLSLEDAKQILNGSGLAVGKNVNYFEVLGLSITDLQTQTESAIAVQVDAAHKKCYSTSLTAGGLPRPDGKTQAQWRTILNQARDTLKDPQKRREHIAKLQIDQVTPRATSVLPTGMVLIPAGDFRMGSHYSEKPDHTVYVDAFYMDECPVTNAQYKTFLDEKPEWRKPLKWYEWGKKHIESIPGEYHNGYYLRHWNGNDYPSTKADHPVTYVSWYAAMAYAQWADKRLPTEAEWEKAARGDLTNQEYPWGEDIDSSKANYGENVGDTTPVAKYAPNGYGLYDMGGNVWEWCLDEYAQDCFASLSYRNPVLGGPIPNIIFNFTNVKNDCMLRGGSWVDIARHVRCAYLVRSKPSGAGDTIGFRCVRPVTP